MDTTKFKSTPIDDGRKVKRDEKIFRVVYAGSFSPGYDFDQVFRAAKLLEKHPDIQIILQGKGELLPYMEKTKNKLKVRNVKILAKALKREEVAKLLSKADSLLLPLRDFGKPYLGISSKLYEYQAVGKPIICCAEGQPADYVKYTQSGIIVKPGDYTQLAKAILLLKENPNLARKLGKNGMVFVMKNLTIGAIGAKMKSVLMQTLTYVNKK